MQLAFWSNYHQTGTTSNLVAVSSMIVLEYRLKVLMALGTIIAQILSVNPSELTTR